MDDHFRVFNVFRNLSVSYRKGKSRLFGGDYNHLKTILCVLQSYITLQVWSMMVQ